MATVTVDNWAAFVDAVQVAGDTVVCPDGAVWDMDSIAPDGIDTLPEIRCAEIVGNGTTIKNLHTAGHFLVAHADPDVLTVSDLHFTNFVLESDALFYCSRATRGLNAQFSGCMFSGLGGTQTRGILRPGSGAYGDNYGGAYATACSFVIDAQYAGAFWACSGAKYCRMHIAIPNGVFAMPDPPLWCYFRIDQPTATALAAAKAVACVFDGQMQAVTAATTPGAAQGYVSIYCTDGIPNVTPTAYFVGVTRQQMRDPVYLASVGFPIGYDPPDDD